MSDEQVIQHEAHVQDTPSGLSGVVLHDPRFSHWIVVGMVGDKPSATIRGRRDPVRQPARDA